MEKVALGKTVPDLTVKSTNNKKFTLSSLRGKTVVFYFYPKDDTPGCTQESKDFRDHHKEFQRAGAEIFGISRDNLESHEDFKCKYEMPFELIADENEGLCKAFDVIKEKNMYGKKSMGIERSTFIIDPKGVVRREFRKVSVPGHVAEMLAAVQELKKENYQ